MGSNALNLKKIFIHKEIKKNPLDLIWPNSINNLKCVLIEFCKPEIFKTSL